MKYCIGGDCSLKFDCSRYIGHIRSAEGLEVEMRPPFQQVELMHTCDYYLEVEDGITN